MTLVVDASMAFWSCGAPGRFEGLSDELVAPTLMWSETTSSVHTAGWRGEISGAHALEMRARLESAPITARNPRQLRSEAWRIADELGWAKTYDAEYVALASILDCHLVTLDARLHRGTRRLGFVVSPSEL